MSAPWSSSAAPFLRPQTQPKQMICTVASMKMAKVPIQKSMVSSATRPLLNQITQREPIPAMTDTAATARPELMPSASSKKALAGCNIEIELVIAARKRRKNQAKPMNRPIVPMCSKTTGRALNPTAKVPPSTATAVEATPRKTTAEVMVMSPPKPTSKSSLVALAVRPDSAMSSFFLR